VTSVLAAESFFALPLDAWSPQIEDRFFCSLKMKNGTFKTTKTSRFAEVESLLEPVLRPRLAAMKNVLDVAVSSGTTTLEFSEYLKKLGARASVVATDLFADGYLIPIVGGLTVLTDSSGFPLQYAIGGHPVRSWTRRLDYFTLAFAPRAAARAILSRSARSLIEKEKVKAVRLVTRQMENRKDIEFIEDDILNIAPALQGRFDLIRAANILNLDYFSESDLIRALKNIRSYLRGPGGLVLINRTAEKTNINSGSLYELDGVGKLQEILKIGKGSEIRDLIASI
jgi:hypothetical protein